MALIKCPTCGHTVSDKAKACPKCGEPIRGYVASVIESKPTSSPPSKTPTNPYSHPVPQQREFIDQSKRSNKGWIIAIVALLIVGIGVFIYLFVNNSNGSSQVGDTSNSSEVDELATAAISLDSAAAAIDLASADEAIPPASSSGESFNRPYYGSDFTDFVVQLYKRLDSSGMTAGQFEDEINISKVSGKQAKFEASDGIRYQMFFDKSPNNSSARLTGIAVSTTTYDKYDACESLEQHLSNNATYYDYNIWRTTNGIYVSPGYSNDRVYAYIYLPNAPNKDAAPRK